VPTSRPQCRRHLPVMTVAAVLALAGLVALVGCGSSSPSPFASSAGPVTDGNSGPGRRVEVVATTTQLQDFARVIGGDCVDVYGVLKPNVDPHDYEPSPADLEAIARADVTVKNGVDLERWFDDTIASAEPTGVIVDSSDGVSLRPGDDEDPAGDPHIWHDPRNAKIMATHIERALVAAEPACRSEFAGNLADYSAQLDALDSANQAALGALTNKKLVTNHDAFGYYVDRYGLDFVGSIIPSFDTSAELSASEVDALVALIRAQGVKAIFSESSLPPKTAAAIGQEAGVKVVEGDDALYGDTLGPPGSPGGTYLEMEAHNTATLVANLS